MRDDLADTDLAERAILGFSLLHSKAAGWLFQLEIAERLGAAKAMHYLVPCYAPSAGAASDMVAGHVVDGSALNVLAEAILAESTLVNSSKPVGSGGGKAAKPRFLQLLLSQV